MLAWIEEANLIVHPFERAILRAMDKAFCDAMNTEFSEYRARQKDSKK